MDNLELDTALKNKLQNVKVNIPPIVDQGMDKAFSRIPKTKDHKLKYGTLAASAVFLCLIVTSFFSPSSARALSRLPLIGSVFQLVGDTGLNFASKNNISTSINKSKIDKDIKITITDVLYDGTRIAIGYTVESKKDLVEVQKPDISINGKELNFTSSSMGNAVDTNKYAGIINVSPEIKVPDKFSMNLTINKVGETYGNWNFKDIPVKYQGTKLSAKTITPLITKHFNNGNLVIKRVTLTNASTEIELMGYNTSSALFDYDWQLYDDKNNSIMPAGASGKTEEGISQTFYRFSPVSDSTKSLTLKFHTKNTDSNNKLVDVKENITGHFPITLEQGDGGKITVTSIEYLEDKTLVHYSYTGNNPYSSGMCLYMEDGNGKNLKKPSVAIKKTEEAGYNFVMECVPVDKNQKLKLCSYIFTGINDVLEFNIPMQ